MGLDGLPIPPLWAPFQGRERLLSFWLLGTLGNCTSAKIWNPGLGVEGSVQGQRGKRSTLLNNPWKSLPRPGSHVSCSGSHLETTTQVSPIATKRLL